MTGNTNMMTRGGQHSWSTPEAETSGIATGTTDEEGLWLLVVLGLNWP